MTACPPALRAKLAALRAVVCDVDGTLTDGRIFMTDAGEPMRGFSTRDGLGVGLLQQANIKVAWLSATSRGQSTVARARMLDIPVELIDVGLGEKGARFTAMCARLACPPQHVAYMGDDVNDLPAMMLAGLSACPADAHPDVRDRVDLVVDAPGGHGAFRILADLMLQARPG
ncbi:MAG: HAD hydrolase family protein [Phycisphaerales bacterium]|nr:HAD hydrolase family protein [Phycisphaerales bacterium]